MDTTMHGRRIKYIELDPGWTASGNPESVGRYEPADLHLSATHHGDHDQFWVVLSVGGKETERYSTRGIKHIVWSPESE
jgi:hypothetical protein